MAEYLVTWKIEVPADNPRDAAWFARECMERPDTTATVFEVTDEDGNTVFIDLQQSDGGG